MEHWGIYLAYGWMATIILAFTDAVQAIRKGPHAQPPQAAFPQLIGSGAPNGNVLPSNNPLSRKRRSGILYQAGVWLDMAMRWPR